MRITIEPLKAEDYCKCSNIWDMKKQPLAEKWLEEIVAGIRTVYVYKIDGEFIGEGALVEDSVVMPGVVIEPGAIVRHAILGEDSRVCRNAVVGGAFGPKEKKQISVTAKGAVVAENSVLLPGEML